MLVAGGTQSSSLSNRPVVANAARRRYRLAGYQKRPKLLAGAGTSTAQGGPVEEGLAQLGEVETSDSQWNKASKFMAYAWGDVCFGDAPRSWSMTRTFVRYT